MGKCFCVWQGTCQSLQCLGGASGYLTQIHPVMTSQRSLSSTHPDLGCPLVACCTLRQLQLPKSPTGRLAWKWALAALSLCRGITGFSLLCLWPFLGTLCG